ncbi:MAG: ASKHA domain-containing protein [Oscillospiraceae bacterium]|nr:ASKHA domain-containing protein [Oscillospiraceae bacterium]
MKITVINSTERIKADFCEGESVLDILRRNGIPQPADCGGAGVCGKCRVFIENNPRLACHTKALDGMAVTLCDDMAAGISTAEGFEGFNRTDDKTDALAVCDIGTTTVTMALINRPTAGIIDIATENNAQASYGCDVISRVDAAKTDNGKLHGILIKQIGGMLKTLLEKNGIPSVNDMFMSGNTVMLHFLYGENPVSMGVYPYNAVFLDSKRDNILFPGYSSGINVYSPPCLASFIGADITAGILSEYRDESAYTLLLDLGTNAETVLFSKDKFYAASAAAGPAFEGAKIRDGCAAIPGAVCNFKLQNGKKHIKTIKTGIDYEIKNPKPYILYPKSSTAAAAGICGSGLIDITAELLRNGLIDGGGLLENEIFNIAEGVDIYAEDIREVQLAKAAICTAIELIIKEAGVGYDDIGRLVLSGGFGTYINAANAAYIGLIPKALASKARAAGNTCLAGTALYAADENSRVLAEKIKEKAVVLDLAAHKDFFDVYTENIMFS